MAVPPSCESLPRVHCVKCGLRISDQASADELSRGRLCEPCLSAAYARLHTAMMDAPDPFDMAEPGNCNEDEWAR